MGGYRNIAGLPNGGSAEKVLQPFHKTNLLNFINVMNLACIGATILGKYFDNLVK